MPLSGQSNPAYAHVKKAKASEKVRQRITEHAVESANREIC